ncbi:MAG: alpha-hydroxy-acid oxidizing protein [Acidimicrobiales bacterium]|nr:alpha-hydroxy-acid oxidizing protein [Acidimicrobiales bacterium]
MQFRPVELDGVKRRLSRAANVEDLRRLARRRLPGGVFDYIDGAAEDERTLAANTDAFGRITFAPRVLRDVSTIDTTVSLFGEQLPFPVVLSPTGFTRIADPQGELAVARAAQRAGLPYTLSTLATRSIEEVRAASTGDLWFQVYVWRDRGLTESMLERAAAAGYSTIVITVDTAVLGRRERDVRRGFTLPPKIGLDTFVAGALKPSWTLAFLRAEPIRFANVSGSGSGTGATDGSDTAVNLAQYINSQFEPALSWADVDWFRARWNGRIVLKGIQTVADAQLAVEHGVDAIALSNHGGRQLDGAPAPIDLVAPVADAVGGRTAILCDGGVRRGSDIVKAVALGADACMIGRAYLYALGAGGERGVDHVLAFLHEGMKRTMSLSGVTSVKELDRDLIASR